MSHGSKFAKSNSLKYVKYLIVLLLFSSCSIYRPPTFLVENFDINAIDKVYIFPAIDGRVDKSKEKDYQKLCIPGVNSTLKKFGFETVVCENITFNPAGYVEALENPDEDFVRNVPPSDSKWVFILVVNDSFSKMTFGSTGGAELTGYLLDKSKGTICWMDKEIGQCGQGGLAGMMMKGTQENMAISIALAQMFQTFPRKQVAEKPKSTGGAGTVKSDEPSFD